MGNSNTKESRQGSRADGAAESQPGPSGIPYGRASAAENPSDRMRRVSRGDLGPLNLPFGSSNGGGRPSSSRRDDAPFERRETKQEKEARRKERERIARIKERERSMKEEHVDGGYLVTTGVYTATEDFHKATVRQLQIDRKIAPFWRGLDDFNDTWAEHQIIAAARGLDIPPADEVPENLIPRPRSNTSADNSTANLSNLTVALGSRTLSMSSDMTGSNPGSSLPSPTSPTAPRTSSPFKPHKALAAALSRSRNNSSTDIGPREINLPHDPFVNGQPLEVFLYKEGIECPLCLLYYPPYLDRTRCCGQIICSECFVQIKRPEPHHREHHGDDDGSEETPAEGQSDELIMEPARCPYCTQTEFGVTYEPPPFRRGLTHSCNASGVGALGTAMSSSSSINSNLSPTSLTPLTPANRKRTQSLSANAPGVITTDRIRPDWTAKLLQVRAQQQRRTAAADALHQAAFVIGHQDQRVSSLLGRALIRRGSSLSSVPPVGSQTISGREGPGPRSPSNAGHHGASARTGPPRERIDAAHLESLMMAEAIRLSLADEEERRRKADKEAKKEAKKREKEGKKSAKRNGDPYGGGSSGSTSSLSLGLGRRRGNSTTGNLRVEASVAAATTTTTAFAGADATGNSTASRSSLSDKGKAVDRGENESGQMSATSVPSLPIPSPSHISRGSSHLRQMSNASSISSSGIDTAPGSYTGHNSGADDPRASGLSLGSRSDEGDNPHAESMFNFRSLAEMVGVSLDGEEDDGDVSPKTKVSEVEEPRGEHVENGNADQRQAELPKLETHETKQSGEEENEGSSSPPHVMITPETPLPMDAGTEESKQLGHVQSAERPHAII